MQWPNYSVNQVYMNFHATAPASPSDEFVEWQHYLIGRASMADYNGAQVFDYPLLDPTEETNYYSCLQTGTGSCVTPAASPAISVFAPTDNSALVTPDGFCTNSNPSAMCVFRYYPYGVGSGSNQMDFRLSRLFNFIRRGYTGQYITSIAFEKLKTESAFPRSDGFSWLSHPADTSYLGLPTHAFDGPGNFASVQNGTLATTLYEYSQEHAHWTSIHTAYFMSGDEMLKDTIQDGMADEYLSTSGGNYNLAYGYGGTNGAVLWNERAVGNYLLNTSKMAESYASWGDPANAALFMANADNVYNTEVIPAPAACMTQWMNGVGGQACNTTWNQYWAQVPANTGQKGISRERGASYMWGQGVNQNSSCGGGVPSPIRASGAFQNSIFMQNLLLYGKQKGGTSWSGYTQLRDLMFGKSQWHLSEMLVDDGTNVWTGNGFRYYEIIDLGNSCNLTVDGSGNGGQFRLFAGGGGTETEWFPFYVQQQYSGSTSWIRIFNQVLQRDIANQGWEELYHYTIAATIYQILHPPNSGATLQTRTITGFVDNGGGSYTLTWTPPVGTLSHRVKYETSGKTIVDWIGFDPLTNAFTGNPATQRNWFAATESTASVTCSTTCSTTIATGQTGLSSTSFMVKDLATGAAPPSSMARFIGGKSVVGGISK
jgi:hypothetical protein